MKKDDEYRSKQMQLLGDQEPIDILTTTPGKLREIAERCSLEQLKARAFEDKWTPNEILAHLADMEWVFGFRIRTILCDDEVTLTPVDQDRWMQRQRNNEQPPSKHIERFENLRKVNVEFWQSLSSEELARAGHHAEAGYSMSLEYLLQLQAGHDLNHLDQLERYLRKIAGRRYYELSERSK